MKLRNQQKPTVIAPSKGELSSTVFQNRVRLAVANQPLSRRKFLDQVANVIYTFTFRGEVYVPIGNALSKWPVPCVFEAMGGHEGRWLSLFIEMDAQGKPKRQVKDLERLRILAIYFAIAHPKTYEHIMK